MIFNPIDEQRNMKITIKQLRKVIKEEVSRILTEADAPNFSGVAGKWFSLMSRYSNDPEFVGELANAWDAMSAAGEVPPIDVRAVSEKIADDFALAPSAISFHLRKNPSATGVTGQELLDAVLVDQQKKQQAVERAAEDRKKPGAVFDREITDERDMNYGRRRWATVEIQPDGSEKVIKTYVDTAGSLGT